MQKYVNIFGVPFTFLPHEGHDGPPPPPPPPKTRIEPDLKKRNYEISWPNVVRIEYVYKTNLSLDFEKIIPLELNAFETRTLVEMAPTVSGKPDITKISEISLKELAEKFRMQRIIFETARDVFDQMKQTWKGSKEILLAHVIRLIEKFLEKGKIRINPPLFELDEIKKRLMLTLNMQKIVQHIWEAIYQENAETIVPVFDQNRPIASTGEVRPWYSGKPCEYTQRSHINFCVFDSTWEASDEFNIDRNSNVDAWVKNDHLGFEILYVFNGVVSKYRPDFIIRFKNGSHLVLETKGQDTQKDKTKRTFLDQWCKAVNSAGGFGKWKWDVAKSPADIHRILEDVSN